MSKPIENNLKICSLCKQEIKQLGKYGSKICKKCSDSLDLIK